MNDNIVDHIAIIMDGNGRWAEEKGLPRTSGHRQGVKRVEEIINAAAELCVKVITLFAFSTENWDRPKQEINVLFKYLHNFLDNEVDKLNKNNIRLIVSGEKEPLPEDIQEKIIRAQDKTSANTGLILNLALNYGARQEIVRAAKEFASLVVNKKASVEELTVDNFNNYLYAPGLPDPDILIRTSGEMRLSNFLLWQLSYAELFFVRKYWPDFTKEDFKNIISRYKKRNRRFGGVNAYKKNI